MLDTRSFKNYRGKEIDELKENEEILKSKLEKNPEDKKLLRKLGESYYFRKDIQGAIGIYEKLEKIGNNSKDLAILGILYYESEKFKESKNKLEKSLALDPKAAFIQFILGHVYSRLGNLQEALFHYRLALVLDLDIYQAHLDFAKKYEDIGRLEKALLEYKTAFSIKDHDDEIKNKILKISEKLERKL